MATPLLAAGDPAPVRIHNTNGAASFLLIGDHAGNLVPVALAQLGVADDDRVRHIGWDIGVAALGTALARRIDACFIRQIYSRLVIDCNRAPEAVDAIPAISDGTAVAGNADLSPTAREARIAAIHAPYQAAISNELARRDAVGRETALVALHSFTPTMGGVARPWHCGILHDAGDPRFALACLAALRGRGDLVVGDNEPYRMDGIDYTIPRHAFAAGRPYVEVEIRQDLLADESGVEHWAAILASVLSDAKEACSAQKMA